MIAPAQFLRSQASQAQIAKHLRACDASFVPPLHQRVDIDNYAAKLAAKAECFEAWSGAELVGLLAAYCRQPQASEVFVSNLSVTPAWHGRGMASALLQVCIDHARQAGCERLVLKVSHGNVAAAVFYKKRGFAVVGSAADSQTLQLFV